MHPSEPSFRPTSTETGARTAPPGRPPPDFKTASTPPTSAAPPKLSTLHDADVFGEDEDECDDEALAAAERESPSENVRSRSDDVEGPMPSEPIENVRVELPTEDPDVFVPFSSSPVTNWETKDSGRPEFHPGHPAVAGDRVSRFELGDGSRWYHRPARREGSAGLERAYFDTSEHLGLGVVPETHVAEVDGRPGSIQRAIPHAGPAPEELAPGEVRWNTPKLVVDEDGEEFEVPTTLQAQWSSVVGTAVQHHVTSASDPHADQVIVTDVDGERQLRTMDAEWSLHESDGRILGGPAIEGVIQGLEEGRSPVFPENVRAGLEGTDVESWTASLRKNGVTDEAIEEAVGRHQRLRDDGMKELLWSHPSWSGKPRVDALRERLFADDTASGPDAV